MIILSIDPSINNVGWAKLDTSIRDKQYAWKWGTWKLEGASLEMRIMYLVQLIVRDVGSFDFLITEKPAFYSSERGQIAAHQNYTIDLAAISFFVAGWFHKDHRSHFAITAITWKGTVSKEITARQFFKCFFYERRNISHISRKKHNITEHSIDACMLLRFWVKDVLPLIPRVAHLVEREWLLGLL